MSNLKFLKRPFYVIGYENISKFIGVFLLLLLVAFLEALGIGTIFPLIAAISTPATIEKYALIQFFMRQLEIADVKELIPYLVLLVLIIFVIKNSLLMLSTYVQGKIIHDQRVKLSLRMFRYYLNMDYDWFMQRKVADLLHNSTGLINNFILIYCVAALKIIAESFVIFSIVSLLLAISLKITLAAMMAILIMGGIYFFLTKNVLVRLGERGHQATLGFIKVIYEGIGGVKEIKVCDAEGFFFAKFQKYSEQYKKNMVLLHTMQIMPRAVIEVMLILMITGIIFYVHLSGQKLSDYLPLIGVYGLAFMRLMPSLSSILSSYSSMQSHKVSLNILHHELTELRGRHTEQAYSQEHQLLTFKNTVEISGLTYCYPKSKGKALNNISLTIKHGQSVAFVGKSGAGKSTLVDVLLGLLKPQQGGINVDGENMLQKMKDWHRLIGYIPQQIFLMDDTILQNIALGVAPENVDNQALQYAIKTAHLQQFIAQLPEGPQTQIGDKGVRLSGGQRQRIGIARALYRNPEILILDEATSALDNETEADISTAIDELAQEKTLIIIAHRLSTLKNCNKLFLMEDGEIVEQGSFSELKLKSAWFRKVSELSVIE